MPIVFTRDQPDGAGRRPITLIHNQPDQLPEARRSIGVEVAEAAIQPPAIEAHQRALPWLTETGEVEWEIQEREDDDPSQIARRVSEIERATGTGGKGGGGERGLSDRIDSLEDRIAALEGN